MFLSKDQMKAFRQFHVANLLNQKGVYREKALEIANQIPAQVEAALDSPSAPVAVLAEELQPVRSKALATGKLPDLPRVSREGLSAVFRGRIEHLTGSLLFNLDKNEDAVVRLKRAVSVLPENSTWWRAAQWHIGTVLNAQGSSAEALAAYLKSYDRTNPNPSRRAVIESLYVKLNGSKDGLDEKIGPARN
jgi:tetratricopeptide (TPR) repeat protein